MGTDGEAVRLIAGRYRLETRLGRGGMGVVWRATDQLLGRQVAVKELTVDDSLPDDDARLRRDRTLREAQAVAQLHHPHIIVVHDVVEEGERPYIVMELIDGGSLADRISRNGPVDVAETARIGVALLSALRTAHTAGVLHRDIKPANVLVETGTGRVVLTDFGIAQVAGATTLTETGSFVGSPEYTAPERMSGSRSGPASDLWSLGVLLCAALSGESPFRRDSLGGILHAVVSDEIRPPSQAEPLLPVVRGLLERDPERRLGAAEAERMLRGFMETGTVPAASAADGAAAYTPTQRDVPWPPAQAPDGPPRYSSRGVLVAALLVAAMAGAGVSAAALLFHGGGGGGGPAPGPSASVSAPRPTATAPTPSRTPPSASPSVHPSSSPPASANSRQVPSGYRLARDPGGFSLAVPEGFTRDPQGQRVFYLSPGQAFRLGVRVSEPQTGGPGTAMRRAAAEGPSTNPGYHDGRVTDTTRSGHPAAFWEFTWKGFSAAEGPRHTFDLCWEEGGRLYDVWVSAPVGKVREAREYFDVAVDTFVPGRAPDRSAGR
ncbi:serine/threonine-protein kinase [Streptomyces sp. NPDC093084]|uniref:serine/threonine-protein kinase n=1 Tax=Streptomyces sp. NPDC093084 TaxID=3155197 RepID=UPI00343883F7